LRASGENFFGLRFSKYITSGRKQQIDEDIHDLAMGWKALDFGARFRYLPLKVYLIWQEGSPVAAGQPPTPPSICCDAEAHNRTTACLFVDTCNGCIDRCATA